jgi:hypothetical protein
MPQRSTFHRVNIWGNRWRIELRSRWSPPGIGCGPCYSAQCSSQATRGFAKRVPNARSGFLALGGVRVPIVTQHKIIPTGLALLALLAADTSIVTGVRMATRFTSHQMPSPLPETRRWRDSIPYLSRL